ncbi:MAG: TolC family protein [Bacteroidales bacterium]
MMKTRQLFTIIVLLVPLLGASQKKLELSLDSAISFGIEYNKTVKMANLSVQEARRKIHETASSGLPQVDAAIDYSNFFGSSATFPGGMSIEFNPTSNFTFSVGQLIFNASYFVGLQTAKLYKNLSETNLEKSEQEVAALITNNYYLALASEKSLGIIRKNKENLKDIYNKTAAMANMGILEKTDVDQLSVQVTSIENAVKASERQVEISYNMLRLQMGTESGTEIKLTSSLDEIIMEAGFEASMLAPFDIRQNLNFQLTEMQRQISEKQLALQKASYLPAITGFYSHTEKILKPEFDFSPKDVIGLNASIPIFSGFNRWSKVQQAKIQLKSTETQQALLEDQLMIQEKQYRFNLKNALEQFQNQEKNVEVAREVFHSINLKYQQGMVSSLDLTTANNNYLQAENAYISSLLQLLQAKTELEKLLNKI